MTDAKVTENIMVYLDGSQKSFRCDNDEGLPGRVCGCNVFHRHPTRDRLVCNACGAIYVIGKGA